jgi:hypothetical protein
MVEQMARRHEPVAAVVAGTADDENARPAGGGTHLKEKRGDLAPGVLHEGDFGNAEGDDRRSIGLAHLLVGEYVHSGPDSPGTTLEIAASLYTVAVG